MGRTACVGRHYHSKKIKPLAFRKGDLVLRLIQEQAGQHKLSPPWEGPFIVSRALHGHNAYYLIDAGKSKKHNGSYYLIDIPRPVGLLL